VTRAAEVVEKCAREWVRDKFESPDKIKVREARWPGLQWEFHLVHGKIREPQELAVFQNAGVKCHSLYEILDQLQTVGKGSFSGSAGGDLAEIVFYYNKERSIAPI